MRNIENILKYHGFLLYVADSISPEYPKDLLQDWYLNILKRGDNYINTLFRNDGALNTGLARHSILQAYLTSHRKGIFYTSSDGVHFGHDNNVGYIVPAGLTPKEHKIVACVLLGGNTVIRGDFEIKALARKLFPDIKYTQGEPILRCSRCGGVKHVTSFYKNSASKTGRAYWCKACTDARKNELRKRKC